MIEGQQVSDWFTKYPDMAKRIEGLTFQIKYPSDLLDGETVENLYRPLELNDIKYIAFKSFFDNSAGIYIWYYPFGVPHCSKIGEIEELERLKAEMQED